jgi:hypothetical protein
MTQPPCRSSSGRACARVFVTLVLGLAFLTVRDVSAGAQLSTAVLVQQSEAIVVVDNTLDQKGTIREWLKGSAADLPSVGALGGVCVPDRALVKDWLGRHARHPGRDTWKKILAAGRVDQVVFLARREGNLMPRCETEVMLGRSFALHPEHPAFRAELMTLLSASSGTQPKTPSPPESPPESPKSPPESPKSPPESPPESPKSPPPPAATLPGPSGGTTAAPAPPGPVGSAGCL